MARKTFLAIHTYKSELAKKNTFESLKNTVRTDYEWADRWNFPKAQCIATWVGTDDFFFCHWEAETEEDIMILQQVHDNLLKIRQKITDQSGTVIS